MLFRSNGKLSISGGLSIGAALELSTSGISVGGGTILDISNNALRLQHSSIKLLGNVSVSGEFEASSLLVGNGSFTWSGKTIYHAGNANMATANWEMLDALVNGDANVAGSLCVDGGFNFLHNGNSMLYSSSGDVVLAADLNMSIGSSIKFGDS